MIINSWDVAYKFLGLTELTGNKDDHMILWMLQLCDKNIQHDETPWCSAFVNTIHFLLGLPRTGSLAARSWLRIGESVELIDAKKGDVVILQRGNGVQPGPEQIFAPGHVAFFDHRDGTFVYLLGGNQGNKVSIGQFPLYRILGIRRFDK